MKNNPSCSSIFDIDFEVIDEVALKTKNLKKKHIFHPIDRVPPQGNITLERVSTIADIEKKHRKKYSN